LLKNSKVVFLINRLVQTVEDFVSEDKENEVKEFFEKNPVPAATRKIQQSLENISLNRKQLEKALPDLEQFFKV